MRMEGVLLFFFNFLFCWLYFSTKHELDGLKVKNERVFMLAVNIKFNQATDYDSFVEMWSPLAEYWYILDMRHTPIISLITRSLTHPRAHMHSLTHTLAHSFTHSLTHPLTHPLTRSLTHPTTHSAKRTSPARCPMRWCVQTKTKIPS